MKLLLISPYFIDSYANHLSMGSAVKFAQNMSRKYQIYVLTTGRKTPLERLNSNCIVESVSGWLIPDPVNYMFSPLLLIKFTYLLFKYQPDLVVVSKYMFFSSFVIPIARIFGFKVITITDTFPGINWFSVSRTTSAIMWIYARLIGIPLLKMSHRVILLHPGLETIARKYHLNYITIPNGIDPKYFTSLSSPSDIHKPTSDFWVGFVGRPETAKGYHQALQLAKSFEKYPRIKFIFAGGNLIPSQQSNIIKLGFRSDIIHIYQLFDVLILPSHNEGLPNVVLEAMSQGIPVVANPVGGVTSVITDQTTGILVSSRSTQDFVSAIYALYRNKSKRTQMGQRAKFSIKKNFNWDKIISSYTTVINEVCAA